VSVTKDAEGLGLFALLGVLALVFFVTFNYQVKAFINGLSAQVGNALSGATGGIGAQVADAVKNAGAAVGSGATTVVTSAADGAGNTLGDWLWNGAAKLFPSLSANGPDWSELNADPMATYDAKQAAAWANNPDSTSIANYVPSGFPDVPVDPSDW
jgi:hypothetical protein